MTRLRVIVPLILMINVAWADEAPCRRDGDNVVCQRDGFDKLVKKLIDEKARADVLDVRLTEMTASRDDVTKAMLACESKPPVVVPPPVKPTWQAVGPVVLSIVGSGVLGVVAMMDGATTGRAVGAVVGFLSVGAGLYWAIP